MTLTLKYKTQNIVHLLVYSHLHTVLSQSKVLIIVFFLWLSFLSGSWEGCWSLSQLQTSKGRIHPWMCIQVIAGSREHLGVRTFVCGYLSDALMVSWHLNLLLEYPCFFPNWGLNQELFTSHPSPLQIVLPSPVIIFLLLLLVVVIIVVLEWYKPFKVNKCFHKGQSRSK